MRVSGTDPPSLHPAVKHVGLAFVFAEMHRRGSADLDLPAQHGPEPRKRSTVCLQYDGTRKCPESGAGP